MGHRAVAASAVWLALGLMLGAFTVEVYREMTSAEPTGMRAFWYTTIG
jgi:hypothetical protein